MGADIEALVLSGELFDGPSPDNGWHEDARVASSDTDDSDDDSDWGRNNVPDCDSNDPQTSIGMGPGRTGVKGVIRDRDEATSLDRARRTNAIEQLNRRMEKASLGGKTFLEEEREREWEKAMLEGDDGGDADRERLWQTRTTTTTTDGKNVYRSGKERKFGHLREVGLEGFVAAVEADKGVWVVVHLHEPSLERCSSLDDTLSHLARLYPQIKFLRSRASSLGFTTSFSRTAPKSSPIRRIPGHYEDDDGDEDDDNDLSADEDDRPKTNTSVDVEMLPTLLVYRDGNLVHNWVRVDWEAGRAGVEELLSKYHILPEPIFATDSDGSLDDNLDDDDDEELPWSD